MLCGSRNEHESCREYEAMGKKMVPHDAPP